MLNRKKRGKLFARRAFILGGIKATVMMALVSRLYYLQVIKSNEYKTFSDSNRIRLMLISPQRGRILDRNGQVIAENIIKYRALLEPQFVKNKDEVITKFANILNLSEEKRLSILNKVKNHRSRRALIIYDSLSWKDLAKLEVNAPDLPGIMIDTGQIRNFRLSEVSSHLIGYLGPVSEKEIDKNPLLNHPDFKIGRSGIEKSFENTLRGKVGVKRVEVDAFGLVVRELSREESIPGKDLKLSINADLQKYAVDRLEGKAGSIVVMSVKTGEILSMVSTPGYNSNLFTQGVPKEYWNSLLTDPDKPLINRPIGSQFPPGSTFKTIVALAALKEKINPNKKIYCPGYVQLGRHRFHCWKKEGHGHVNMEQAIMHSCNSYFYHISRQVGVDNIAEMAKIFGLGDATGISIAGEKAGLVPTKNWKLKHYKTSWQVGDTFNVGIGQGYVLSTPLQLAVMSARIASGKAISPTLDLEEAKNNDFSSLNIPSKNLAIIQRGMYDVVNVPGGTAFGSRTRNKDFVMAGKTGTVQVISKKGLKEIEHKLTEEQLNRTKNHAIFVGYGSYDDPDYAISVIVEHGGGGSAAAAPVARDVLKKVKELEIS